MAYVTIDELAGFIHRLLTGSGIGAADADIVTNVYIRATLRGVGHHDIHDLYKRLTWLADDRINKRPKIKPVRSFAALESYDGDNGLGELCSQFIMRRAVSLAGQYGIGLCTIRHSNHFLAAAPYTEWATEQGYIGLIFTRDKPTMNAPGATCNVIGNNPFGFAVGQQDAYPLMLDIAMAYTSIGKLNQLARNHEEIPSHWGKSKNGSPTVHPGEVLDGGTVNPVGLHKGFGLALLVEILTGVLSGGQVIDELHPTAGEMGFYAQTAIAIKPDGLLPPEQFQSRLSDMMERIGALGGQLRMPGQRSTERKHQMLREGLALSDEMASILNDWARKLNVPGLSNFDK